MFLAGNVHAQVTATCRQACSGISPVSSCGDGYVFSYTHQEWQTDSYLEVRFNGTNVFNQNPSWTLVNCTSVTWEVPYLQISKQSGASPETWYIHVNPTARTITASNQAPACGGNTGDNGNGNNNNTNNGTPNYDDLILGRGDKQFIFHTQMQQPNNPPVVYIAPKKSGSNSFDWDKQITFNHDGNVSVGVTDTQAKNAKLRLNNSMALTDTLFGLHSTVNNTNTSLTKPVYGIYSSNTNASSSSLYGAYFKNKQYGGGYSVGYSYGIYVDNENSTYGNYNYGVYVSNSAGGYGSSTYGFYAKNTAIGGSKEMYGLYADNTYSSGVGTTYGAYLKNSNNGNFSGNVYGIHSTNNSTANGSVYGAYLSSTSTSTESNASVYGLYSSVSGGVDNKRYAGYFTGGNVVVMDGNVGIGTANPQAKLEVSGVIKASEIVANKITLNESTGSFQVKGSFNNFYPVVFKDAKWYDEEVSILELSRFSTHTDSQWLGSLYAKFTFHSIGNGHASHFIDADIFQHKHDGEALPFIAGWEELSFANSDREIVIWLRGGNTTYYFKSNGTQQPRIYDGVQNPPSFQNPGGKSYTFKTAVDPEVNSKGTNLQHNLYTLGESNYFKGNVGIGTMNPSYKLDVDGIIRAREVLVNINTGADFVFNENHTLRPLDEVHHFIQTNKHLPEIPPAADMVNNGLDMGEFQIKLLQKIEELTLYIIAQDKRIKELEKNTK